MACASCDPAIFPETGRLTQAGTTMSAKIQRSIAAPLLAVWGFAGGGELAYVCTVEQVYNVSNYGQLIESELGDKLEGKRFAVSRVDGKILGEVLDTPSAESTQVVDRGSGNHSFKAVANFGDRFQSLEVQEFREGERKPFVASSMGGIGIVTGVCR
jgi:hypothetical protein